MTERSGKEAAQSAIRLARDNVKSGTYNARAKKVKAFIRISVDGIVAVDLKNGSELCRNATHRITAWYPDTTAKDTFGVVVKGEGGGEKTGELDEYSCIVLKSPKAKATLNALKQLLEIVFEPTFEETADVPQQKETNLEGISAADINDEGTWECKDCTFVNFPDKNACVLCHEERKIDPDETITAPIEDGNGTTIDNADDEGPIESYEATHDEEIEPDYQNLFESHGITYDENDGGNYMNLPDGHDGEQPDYMNLPDEGADGADYMNLPDVKVDAAHRALSPDSPGPHQKASPRPRAYSDNNPFAKSSVMSRRLSAPISPSRDKAEKNPFDDSDEDSDEMDMIDFGALFKK